MLQPGLSRGERGNGLGNIATVTKHCGQSAHDYFYDPYGNIIDNNGRPEDSSNWTDPHNHYLLNGKEWDEEMRLHYFGARYYDSAAGVWLTQDIYRGEPRQPMTLHRTLYVLANPVNYVDAYGYMAEIVPNGYGGYGGGNEPVHTGNYERKETHANDPIHFYLPDPSHTDFGDFWGESIVTHERPRDPYADLPWPCTAGGFCLLDLDYYGPGLYNERGLYIDMNRDDLLALFNTDMSALTDIHPSFLSGCAINQACWELAGQLQEQYGWEVSGWRFNYEELQNFWDAAQMIEAWFERNGGGDARGRMRETFGGTSFFHQEQTPLFGLIETSADLKDLWGPHPIFGFAEMKDRSHVLGSSVYLNMADPDIVETIIHEMGHVLDTLVFRKFGQYQARKTGFYACESLIASYPTGKWAVTEAFLKSWSERRKPTFFKYLNKRP